MEPISVILAAGQGTRMNSAQPKALHALAGRPMIAHVMAAAAAHARRQIVVLAPEMEETRAFLAAHFPGAEIVLQPAPGGTGDALAVCRPHLQEMPPDAALLVLFADSPLMRPQTLARTLDAIAGGAALAITVFTTPNPGEYGRVILQEGEPVAIVESPPRPPASAGTTADATSAEGPMAAGAPVACNGGVMAISGAHVAALLDALERSPAEEGTECYLTQLAALAHERGLKCAAVACGESEARGVNTRADLTAAEAAMQERLRARALAAGATLQDPASTFFSHDTLLARDVTVAPCVVFGPGVCVDEGAYVAAFSHLEGVSVGPGARVGPHARLRPGTAIGAGARIGNFVEIKNARVGAGAKISHLAYVGDARVGAQVNVGAGAITCNYDGFAKHETDIGDGAFIGSNATLVAPVRVGSGAYVGAGSVIVTAVADGALALARAGQQSRPGAAARLRRRRAETS